MDQFLNNTYFNSSTMRISNGSISNDSILDVQRHVFSYLPDSRNVQLAHSGYRNLVVDMYQTNIAHIKQLLNCANLTNDNALDYSGKIRSLMSNSKDLYFRKKFDEQAASILTHLNSKHLSLNNTKSLLSAININVSKTYSKPRSLMDSLEISSLQLADIYYDHFDLTFGDNIIYLNQPFGIIANAFYYKALLKLSLNKTLLVSDNTIIWPQPVIEKISNEICNNFPTILTHYIERFMQGRIIITLNNVPVFKTTSFDDHDKFIFPVEESAAKHEFWTELILKIIQIDNDKPNNLTFRLGIGFNIRSRSWIESVVRLSYFHYTANNEETVDALVHSLATIFFKKESISVIALMPDLDKTYRSKLFDTLVPLRLSEWDRMSLYTMKDCNCSNLAFVVILVLDKLRTILEFFAIYLWLVMLIYHCWLCCCPKSCLTVRNKLFNCKMLVVMFVCWLMLYVVLLIPLFIVPL